MSGMAEKAMPDISLVASGGEVCYTEYNIQQTGCVFVKNLNAYLIAHPKLLLTLMWVFVALAVVPGVVLNLVAPYMSFFKYIAILIVPAAIALYLRILYSHVQEEKKEARRAQKAAENEARHQHKKKK